MLSATFARCLSTCRVETDLARRTEMDVHDDVFERCRARKSDSPRPCREPTGGLSSNGVGSRVRTAHTAQQPCAAVSRRQSTAHTLHCAQRVVRQPTALSRSETWSTSARSSSGASSWICACACAAHASRSTQRSATAAADTSFSTVYGSQCRFRARLLKQLLQLAVLLGVPLLRAHRRARLHPDVHCRNNAAAPLSSVRCGRA